MAWATSYGHTIPTLKDHINGLRHGLASVVPGDIRASWEGVDGAHRLYDYTQSHSGDAQFMSALKTALAEEKISWLLTGGVASAVAAAASSNSSDVPLKAILDTSLHQELVRTLGGGGPGISARWWKVAVELSRQEAYNGRLMLTIIQDIEAHSSSGPLRATAFVSFLTELGVSAIAFIIALRGALLEVSADQVEQALGKFRRGAQVSVFPQQVPSSSAPIPEAVRGAVWVSFTFNTVEEFRQQDANILQLIAQALHVSSGSIEIRTVIKINPACALFILDASLVVAFVQFIESGQLPCAIIAVVASSNDITPPAQLVTRANPVLGGQITSPPRDYSDPTVLTLPDLFMTSEKVDQQFIERHKNEHHLFGTKSLSSYLERKLKNEALPEFDLVTEVANAKDSTVMIVIAGIIPIDIEALGIAQHWVKLPWQSGAGSSAGLANSWRPSWYKFVHKRFPASVFYVLAAWPGFDSVAHYALTVCCTYPSLCKKISAWHFPVLDAAVMQFTKFDEVTTNYVKDAIVVLGESTSIKKYLVEQVRLQEPQEFVWEWYSIFFFASARIVLLQVKHPYWGSIAGQLAATLFSAGCKELVHCGNVGRLMQNFEKALTVISAPLTACHVSKLSRHRLNLKFLDYLDQHPPSNIQLCRDHNHISISSPVLETKDQYRKWADCSTIDVEVYSLAEAAAKVNRPLSCLHYISDVVSNTQSLGEKWEDLQESGVREAKVAMVACIANYLNHLTR